eukprot:2324017-Rhodomonas_salina.3
MVVPGVIPRRAGYDDPRLKKLLPPSQFVPGFLELNFAVYAFPRRTLYTHALCAPPVRTVCTRRAVCGPKPSLVLTPVSLQTGRCL